MVRSSENRAPGCVSAESAPVHAHRSHHRDCLPHHRCHPECCNGDRASFDYLLKTALRESNLNPDAKASSSSATGLFQFIDQTWLGTLKKAGASLGYGNYAESILQAPSGRYVVQDPAQRQAIMRLRTDPTAASAMAAAFTNDNAALLIKKLGRPPTDGELYIAHFMGPTGSRRPK